MAETKVKLSVDGVQSVVTGLGKVHTKLQEVGGSISTLSAIGGTLSLGAFAAMIKSSIDAADGLTDLGKSTSLTVEQLSGLKWAAQLSGTDLNTVAKGVSKLAVEMGKDAEKFAQIGVTAKDPIEALKQLADVFISIEDPQARAAFGSAVLGKSWEDLAPLLSEGGAKIGEMVEKGQRLAGVTQEMADRAGEFNDQLDEMKFAADGLKLKLAEEMLPAMTDIIKATKLAYEEGGKLEAAWVALGGVGAFLFTDEFSSAAVKIQGLQKEIDDLEKRKRNYMGPGFLQEYLIGSDSEIDAKIAATKAQIEALTKSMQKPPAKQPGWTSGADLPTGVAGLIAGGEGAKKKAAEAATKELDAQKKLLAELAGLTSSFADDWDALNKVYGQGKISVEQLTAAQSDLLSKQPAIKAVLDEKKKAADELAKADLEAAQAHTQHINSLTGSLDALKAEVQAQQDYVDRLGLSEMAIAELDAARLEEQATALEGLAIKKLERDLDETQYALYKAQAEELRKLANLKRAGAEKSVIVEQQQKDAEEALKIWDNFHENVQRNLGDQLYGAMSGEFDNIADAWKSMLRRMTADAMAAQLTESLFKGGKSGQGLVGDLIGAGIGLIGGLTGSSIGANASAADYDQYGVGLPVPSASRGFDIPTGVNPLTQLHEREMVLPAEHADVIRGLATQPGAGGGKQITFNYYQTNNIDSRTDRGAIEEDLLRIKDATKLEMVDELQRAGAI